jgi:hypothetical protein
MTTSRTRTMARETFGSRTGTCGGIAGVGTAADDLGAVGLGCVLEGRLNNHLAAFNGKRTISETKTTLSQKARACGTRLHL